MSKLQDIPTRENIFFAPTSRIDRNDNVTIPLATEIDGITTFGTYDFGILATEGGDTSWSFTVDK